MRQMAGGVEDVHRELRRERLGMADRDNAVVAAPDQLNRYRELAEAIGKVKMLAAIGEPCLGDRGQRRLDTVEPLVAQSSSIIARLTDAGSCTSWLNTSAASRRRLARIKPSINGPLISGPSPAEAIKVRLADPLRLPQRDECANGAPHRMADEMGALDAERIYGRIERIGQCLRVARADIFDRTAVPRQIECYRAPGFGQSRLGKHPGVQIAAKPWISMTEYRARHPISK